MNVHDDLQGPFSTSEAITNFKKQFRSKTGVDWKDRLGMEPKAEKYFFIGMCHSVYTIQFATMFTSWDRAGLW